MTINCADLTDFVSVIAGLVKEGLTFRAHTSTLTIELLGGY